MEMKRHYEKNADGSLRMKGGGPVVKGVEVLRAGPRQKFSPEVIITGGAEGWLSFNEGKITIKAIDGSLTVYRVLRVPGYYCCHCGEKLPGDPQSEEDRKNNGHRIEHAKAHGAPSPDRENPAGYRGNCYFDCELEVS